MAYRLDPSGWRVYAQTCIVSTIYRGNITFRGSTCRCAMYRLLPFEASQTHAGEIEKTNIAMRGDTNLCLVPWMGRRVKGFFK